MRNLIRRWVPSMFHRRLLLLAVGFAFVFGLLGLQMTRLTVVQGDQWRERAESALSERHTIPTLRGAIYDAKGRVIAHDRAGFDICVHYAVFCDEWPYKMARKTAAKAAGAAWKKMDPQQHEALIAAARAPFDAQVRQMWAELARVGGITDLEMEDRRATVMRRVQLIVADVASHRMRQRDEDSDEPGDPGAGAGAVGPISEQTTSHAVLNDVGDEARVRIEQLIAAAPGSDPGAPGSDPATSGATGGATSGGAVWKQVSIERSRQREYPLETVTLTLDRRTFPGPLRQAAPTEVTVEGVGLNIIGVLRAVQKEDFDAGRCKPYRRLNRGQNRGPDRDIDLGGYLPGDLIGRWGIEKSQEAHLRGLRGLQTDQLDSGRREQTDPVPGMDIALTLDIMLQARIQALMDPGGGLTTSQAWHHKQSDDDPPTRPHPGDTLNYAAVVLDVQSGGVLAAVSGPSLSLRQLKEQPSTIWSDKANTPWINRPVTMAYEPGSTVKPLVLAAAITDGKLNPGDTIACNGFLDERDPHHFRCWIFKQFNSSHGPLDGAAAIARSCNIFFYTLGRSLGAARLVQWYQAYGMGQRLLGSGAGSELPEESPGILPDLRHANDPKTPNFSQSDAQQMGIGQGPVALTVLQAANAYATLARGGISIPPTFIRRRGDQEPSRPRTDLHLDPRGIDLAIKGLDQAVNADYGTAHSVGGLGHELIFNLPPGVRVIGKSGTADAAPRRIDSDGDGRLTRNDQIVRSGAHGWFIAMVYKPGSARPDYVIAVVVEYAGSGGAVSGPIVNQIIAALKAEGYL